MSNNCYACLKVVKQTERIVCTQKDCARVYHFVCSGVNAETAKKVSSSWLGPCCKRRRAGDNTNTPVKSVELGSNHGDDDSSSFVTTRKTSTPKTAETREGALDSQLDLPSHHHRDELLALIRNAVKSELDTMKGQISTIESTVSYISTQYDDLMNKLSATTIEMKNLKDENLRLRSDINANASRLRHLEEENARQQQWSRLQNVEVAGVPESKGEDTVDLVIKLADKMGITLTNSDVEFAHRVQARQPSSSANGRTIIARFRHRRTKDSIIAASRKHRGIKPADIGMSGNAKYDSTIYVNEHLTMGNRTLLKECKLKAKESSFKFVWTKNCRIFVRRNETSPPIPIITKQDLKKIG